jgi:predicted dehydrogenase
MKNVSRRNFVKSSAAFAAGAMILPSLKSCSPNSKLNLAFVGVGGRGAANLKGCAQFDKEMNPINNIVALCDVSDERAASGFDQFPKAKRFKDFRVMLDKMGKEIDAVVITTPDHTHFPAAMASMEMGKHIYVDKPLAHNIWQLRTLRKAAKHYNVITQLGNQGHTTEGIRFVKEWYEAGVLGEVTEVIAWFNGPHFHEKGYFLKPNQYPPSGEDVPTGLDWDTWLGPVSQRSYSHFYLPRFWRGWYEFAMLN